MTEIRNREAFRIQQFYCTKMDAPIYAKLCAALADGLSRESRTGACILDWPGEPTRDAVPLRLIGGLHALVLAGADSELTVVFAGDVTDEDAIRDVLQRCLITHDDLLLPWLDGPPQTNDPGRSAALMTGLLEIARRHGPRVELLEIGSSAGLNLMIDRYRFDLGGVRMGPSDASLAIEPEWHGEPPPDVPIDIMSVRGCDIAPLDAADPAVEARLSAYIWPEMPERLPRLRAACAMVRSAPVDLYRSDAADWIEGRLAEPQADGVTRVMMHSVVWQYLPDATAGCIRSSLADAAGRATDRRPLARVAMEPDRALGEMSVRLRSWPGHSEWRTVATTHSHGLWIDGSGSRQTKRIDLPPSANVSL